MSTDPIPFANVEEYLEYDRKSEWKNEYLFGKIVARAGATPWHSIIAANITHLLNRTLFGSPCRVFDAGVRVCVNRKTLYSYPDATVACGPLDYTDGQRDTITNPKLVVEVLSPSTRNCDLGDKARMYMRIPSVEALLFVEQETVRVEHWKRASSDQWSIQEFEDSNASIQIDSVSCAVPVGAIYTGVEFQE
jgi:Uma2 family endonuclease